jgi:hypothetical protein
MIEKEEYIMEDYSEHYQFPELTDDGIVTPEGKLYPNGHRIVKIARTIRALDIEKNYDELVKYHPSIIHETVGFEMSEDELDDMYNAMVHKNERIVVFSPFHAVTHAEDVLNGEEVNPYGYWKSLPGQIVDLIKKDAEARGIDVSEQSVIAEYTTLHGDGMDPVISERIDYCEGYYKKRLEKYKDYGLIDDETPISHPRIY